MERGSRCSSCSLRGTACRSSAGAGLPDELQLGELDGSLEVAGQGVDSQPVWLGALGDALLGQLEEGRLDLGGLGLGVAGGRNHRQEGERIRAQLAQRLGREELWHLLVAFDPS